MEQKELDLNKPIFVIYINASNLSPERVENYISEINTMFSCYNNITTWVIASNYDKIECIWDGSKKNKEDEIPLDLIQEINSRIEFLSETHTTEDFKINIRDWRINKIIDGLPEEQTGNSR